MQQPIAVLYEHPEWFKPLFAELDRRNVPHVRLYAADHVYDPDERQVPYALVVNRMSPSAWMRGQRAAIFHSLRYLEHLDHMGVPVLNGADACRFELSKAAQYSLMTRLGLHHPATRVLSRPEQALTAAAELTFPVLIKPNIGGSGAGIQSFATMDDLTVAVRDGGIDFGIDHVGLLQEHLPAHDDAIIRIEIVGGKFLYAIRLLLTPGTFNLCPADYCELPGIADGVSGRGLAVEGYQPSPEIIDDARRLVAAAGMDVGGVEYLVNARDGQPYFYDLNALSNFVADAPTVIGFNPYLNLVDLIVERSGLSAPRMSAA
ncbi:MAG: ATP-grasp domain-containing protein [Candidatus Limnocylindria bacterium]